MSDLEPAKPARPQNKNLIPGQGRNPKRFEQWHPVISAEPDRLERAKRIVRARAIRDGTSEAQTIARIILESERSSTKERAARSSTPDVAGDRVHGPSRPRPSKARPATTAR